MPPELVAYLAEQLEIADSSCLGEYVVRRTTRFEHQAEIVAACGPVAFAGAESELAAWVTDQTWITGDGLKAIFSGAVAWCRARRVLLPGVTTLQKLVSAARESAEQRLWAQLSGQLSPSATGALLGLLEVPEGTRQRVSELDRLRKGVFRPSSKGMLAALERVGDLAVAGSAMVDVAGVPPSRLLGLAQHGLSGKATQLRRMTREHRLAVLAATPCRSAIAPRPVSSHHTHHTTGPAASSGCSGTGRRAACRPGGGTRRPRSHRHCGSSAGRPPGAVRWRGHAPAAHRHTPASRRWA
ncbi:DUF4158 domain-containing protein [Nocardia gipuzkoensis]